MNNRKFLGTGMKFPVVHGQRHLGMEEARGAEERQRCKHNEDLSHIDIISSCSTYHRQHSSTSNPRDS